MKYYFLIASFPDLNLDTQPTLSFKELVSMLKLNVFQKDLDLVKELLLLVDIKNIRALWKQQPIDSHGNLTKKELEEALLIQENLPEYIFDFLDRYETLEDRLHYFAFIYSRFFQEAAKHKGFLQKYFTFEREIRLVLTALRCKAFERDLLQEMQFEDPTDEFVSEIMMQKDAEEYDPPKEYEALKILFKENVLNPKELQRRFLQFKLQKIEEMEETEIFSIDQVLGYIVRLMIVESWFNLDEEKGSAIMSSIA